VGLGLAVPNNAAGLRIVFSLMREGRVRRAYLGAAVTHRPIPPRLTRRPGQEAGVMVKEIVEGSPAARLNQRIRPLSITRQGEIGPPGLERGSKSLVYEQ
jgi:S1-C subfamily serine protease